MQKVVFGVLSMSACIFGWDVHASQEASEWVDGF
jgi:hypothetical protein